MGPCPQVLFAERLTFASPEQPEEEHEEGLNHFLDFGFDSERLVLVLYLDLDLEVV